MFHIWNKQEKIEKVIYVTQFWLKNYLIFKVTIYGLFPSQYISHFYLTIHQIFRSDSAKNHCGLSLIYTWTTDKQLLCSSLASFSLLKRFSGSSNGKESVYNAGRPGFNSWVRKVPWRRAWQLTPIFLPGESHGQRSLVGYIVHRVAELDMTEQLAHTQWDIKWPNIDCQNVEKHWPK